MRHGSLFSGIGGFDLAAEWMGWENVFHCEWNEFGQKVLKHYWPNAISYGDITKTDFTIHRGKIDILTGGFPCQPFSMAGKRKGTDDPRHLWPQMLRVIREIKPTYIVGENVGGILSWNGGLVFEQVCADLEAEAYEVQPFVLPACGKDAPHRRDRVWFVAHSTNAGGRINVRNNINGAEEIQRFGGVEGVESCKESRDESAANTTGEQSQRVRFEQREFGYEKQGKSRGGSSEMGNWDAANTVGAGCEGEGKFTKSATQSKRIGDMRCGWERFPTQPPVRGRNDGIPSGLVGITVSKHRNESIKAYGNAIVPQVAYEIFKAIFNVENSPLPIQ